MGLLNWFSRNYELASLLEADDEKLAKRIEADWKRSLTAKKGLNELWAKLDKYYNCEYWDSKRPSWRLNPATNYVYKQVQQKKAMVNKTNIDPMCAPIEDIDSNNQRKELSKLFNDVAKFVAIKIGLNENIKDEIVESGILLGIAPIKVYWDDSVYGGSEKNNSLWKGEVAAEVLDPANVFPDPRAFETQKCRYIDIAIPKTLEWYKDNYPDKYDQIKADSKVRDVKIYDRPENETDLDDEELLHEYWWKEDGGVHVAYMAGGVILDKITYVYAHGRYPITCFVPKRKRKSFWGMPEPKQLLGNQESLNKILDLKLVNLMLTANRQKVVNVNSGIDISKLTNEPGLIIPSNGDVGQAIKWDIPPQLPGEVFQSENQLREDMKDIGGIYEAATGEAPGKITAASAIQMLQEQASIPIEDIVKALLRTYREIYEMIIELVKENYEESRLIKILGEDDTEEVFRFRGTDYIDMEMEVTVAATSSATTTKAYLAEIGTQLYNMPLSDGMVLRPEEFVELVDFPGKEKVIDRLRKLREQMEAQNMMNNANHLQVMQAMMQYSPELQQILSQMPIGEMIKLLGMPEEEVIMAIQQGAEQNQGQAQQPMA